MLMKFTILILFPFILPLQAGADSAAFQSLDQFIQNDRSIINAQDEDKIRNAVAAAYPHQRSDSLVCKFQTSPVSGHYQSDETRFDIQEELKIKNTLYFYYRESGKKDVIQQSGYQITDIHSMKEWKALMHHQFRKVRARGYTYGGMCVSTDEIKKHLKGNKQQVLKILTKEGMKVEQIHFQEAVCPSDLGPAFSAPTSMDFDETLLSSDYQYVSLVFSCQQTQISKIEPRPLINLPVDQPPPGGPPPMTADELKPSIKREHPDHFYLKETFFDRLREKMGRCRKNPRVGTSSLKCPQL